MTHEENNFGGRAENPVSDEQKISNLLRDLQRVEAPKDFDFHLKARIANARPDAYRKPSLFPILKYAMPLGLFVAVGTGVFIATSNDTQIANDLVSQPQNPILSTPVPAATSVPESRPPDGVGSERGPVVASTGTGSGRRPSVRETSDPASNRINSIPPGSRDFTQPNNSALKALSAAPTPRTPTGMSLNPKRLDEAFRLIDAEAAFEGGSWVVKSVKANGLAEQLGLKAGDKVNAIDGMPVHERSEFPASFGARTIQVQRGGETVELGGGKRPQ